MSPARVDVWRLIGDVEAELRRAQTQLTELRAMLAADALTGSTAERAVCPECGYDCGNARQRFEHRQHWHGVGEPVEH